MTKPDKLHYVRLPKAQGARAEMTRLAYTLAGKPYVDVHWSFSEVREALEGGKNPFNQLPFVETPDGKFLYQTIAIMQHVGRGTPVWPSDPDALNRALAVGMGGYDLYQWFGSFAADDEVAKKKFETRRAPQFFNGLNAIYEGRKFAAGDEPSFADCIVHQAVVWCVRRNEVSKQIYETTPHLRAFIERFEAVPAVKAFLEKQAAARAVDDSL